MSPHCDSYPRPKMAAGQSGLAIIMVVVTVALLSIIVIELAYSTNIRARGHAMVARSVKAEYLCKSALNLARALVQAGESNGGQGRPPWHNFENGVEIPAAFLGIDEPSLRLSLQISPEDRKISLAAVQPVFGSTGPLPPYKQAWADALVQLFKNLGFDADKEEDLSSEYKGRHFTSEEMVGNLIDYQDQDSTTYSDPKANIAGFEGDSDAAKKLAKNEKVESLQELSRIPGFTPARIRQVGPFVSAYDSPSLNINSASETVLAAFLGDQNCAQQIRIFREGDQGPFDQQNMVGELQTSCPAASQLFTYLKPTSRIFEVIAKVDFGNSTNFMRAVIDSQNGGLPEIRSLEIY